MKNLYCTVLYWCLCPGLEMDGGVGTLLQLGAGAILSYKHSVEIKKPSVYEGCDRVLKGIRVIMLSTLLHTYFTLKNLLSKPTCKGNFTKGFTLKVSHLNGSKNTSFPKFNEF